LYNAADNVDCDNESLLVLTHTTTGDGYHRPIVDNKIDMITVIVNPPRARRDAPWLQPPEKINKVDPIICQP
jgi:hypothetical protein